jgi:hypothetical protein
MDIKTMTVRQLKTLLKQFSIVSLGVRDIVLKNAIEDELNNRKEVLKNED